MDNEKHVRDLYILYNEPNSNNNKLKENNKYMIFQNITTINDGKHEEELEKDNKRAMMLMTGI